MKNTYKIPTKLIPTTSQSLEIEYVENGYSYGSSEVELTPPYEFSEFPPSYLVWIQDRMIDSKVEKIYELNKECDKRLFEFRSNALGEIHIYDMKQEDQINLMALVIANIDSFFRCTPLNITNNIETKLPKQNIPHTKEQLLQVYTDALKYKSDLIYQCGVLKAYVNSLDDIKKIEVLQWNDYEAIKPTLKLTGVTNE